jgi:AraC-like DNA-binding protein
MELSFVQAIRYEQVRPPAALSESIECFWRLLLPVVIANDEIISAEGRAEILFQFQGQSQIIPRDSDKPFDCASSWLMRPFAHALHVRQVGVTSSAMIGIRFSPAGWAAFRHHDTTENQPYAFMPLDNFYKASDVRFLEEELYQRLFTPEWAEPLIRFFTERKIEQVHYQRIAYATEQLGKRQLSIAAVANEVNLSERQFGRVFRELVGLSPKQFSRIARLNRVLAAADYKTYGLSLEQIALRYGYHDAPHLIHEFQALADMSPVDYFSTYHDLIEQKFWQDDRFLQSEADMMRMLSNQEKETTHEYSND